MKKKEFDNILKSIGLSRQEFADITKLTYGSVSNWNDDNKPVPGWVKSWLENYIKAKDLDRVADAVAPILQKRED